MICDFKSIIKKHNMLSVGDTVVVGLSGGADSMTLLHLMCSIKDEYDLDIVACHVNHLLRGDESDRDMRFVGEVCKNNGIRLETLVVDVKSEAKKTHESVEECGRRMRYSFFEKHRNGGKIATAHNLCDNEETVILNLARGTGISGMKGISHVRGNIIRPLLDFSRDDIETYCKENNITFVHDSSNDSDLYKRNFVRHNILPKIKELEPSFDSSFMRFVALVEDDNEFFDQQVCQLIEQSRISDSLYDVSVLTQSHRSVLSRAISRLIFEYSGFQVEKKHVDILIHALNSGSKKVQITAGIFAVIKKNTLHFEKELPSGLEIEIPIDTEGEYSFFNKKIVLEDLSQKVYNKLSIDFFDCDKIVGDLKLRNRREGDRISLQKRNISKTLKKLFCEDSLPLNEREKIPVISDDFGVVWVLGYGCDNRCKTDVDSKRIVGIKCKKED